MGLHAVAADVLWGFDRHAFPPRDWTKSFLTFFHLGSNFHCHLST